MGQESSVVNKDWLTGGQFEIIAENTNDAKFGTYKIVRFPQIPDKSRYFIIKTFNPNKYQHLEFDPEKLSKRIRQKHCHIAAFVMILPNKEKPDWYDLLFEYSNITIEDVAATRALTEQDIWQIFEFLCSIGHHFETHQDHFYDLKKRSILFINNKMKLFNQHLYDEYIQTVIEKYLCDEGEAVIFHKAARRKSSRAVGLYILSLALNRKGDVEYKTSDDVLRRLKSISDKYSSKLLDTIRSLCLSDAPPTFAEIRAMRQSAESKDSQQSAFNKSASVHGQPQTALTASDSVGSNRGQPTAQTSQHGPRVSKPGKAPMIFDGDDEVPFSPGSQEGQKRMPEGQIGIILIK